MKSISEINEKIKKGCATVLTAEEFKTLVREGNTPSFNDVDVVTCATCAVMSGTYAQMTIPVEKPGLFRRVQKMTLNGVSAFCGPCPNEGLGTADVIVYATEKASKTYGGGHLFRDIVEGNEIEVIAEAEGKTYEKTIFGDEIESARMLTTRSAFKNYSAFVNESKEPFDTIFSVLPLNGRLSEATVSGCGEINPLQNDPDMRYLKSGTKILLNGSIGRIIGQGTRSSLKKPNLSVYADMSDMMPEFMGGFVTSKGPECITTIATALPVTDKKAIECLSVLDSDIILPVEDVVKRSHKGDSDYGQIWQGTDIKPEVNPMNCLFCGECPAGISCPTRAIMPGGGIISSRCVSCGTCVFTCPGEVYTMNMGNIEYNGNSSPVKLRQSDKSRANEMTEILKDMIEKGDFTYF